MKNSAKIIRLAFVSVILGITFLGSVQPASAFSFNPIKAVKHLAKAAVNVGKSVVSAPVKLANNIAKGPVGKVAGQLGVAFGTAFRVGGQLAMSSGKGLVTGGAFFGTGLAKIATSKDPLQALRKVAVLGTPLAPFALAKQTYDSVKHPPRVRDLVPTPPTFAGLSRGAPLVRVSAPNSVFATPKSAVFGRGFDPKRPLAEVKRTMEQPARRFEEFKRIGNAAGRTIEEPKRKIEEVKRTVEEPKRNEVKRTTEEPKQRKLEEAKRTTEEPKQRKLEEVKRTTEEPKLKKMTAEPKPALAAPKPMMATPKPMMTPTPPPMGGYGTGMRH